MTPVKYLLLLIVLACSVAKAQDTLQQPLPSGYLSSVAARVEALEEKLEGKSEQAIRVFQKQEERIYRKIARLDSTRAAQFLTSSRQQYQQLEHKLKGNSQLTQYLPYLDTLKTSLKFLGEHQQLLSKAKQVDKQLSTALSKVNGEEKLR